MVVVSVPYRQTPNFKTLVMLLRNETIVMKPVAVTYVVFTDVNVIVWVVCNSYEIFEGMNRFKKKWKLFDVNNISIDKVGKTKHDKTLLRI
jgi:hypothetical protein